MRVVGAASVAMLGLKGVEGFLGVSSASRSMMMARGRAPFVASDKSERKGVTRVQLFEDSLREGAVSINSMNDELESLLEELRSQDFFRLYSVDMLASCEYMPQELFECYTESCEIYPIDEEDIPDKIRIKDYDEHDFEMDGWARWDMPSDDYYDVAQFPEEFTGYDGSDVWRFIHARICFYDNDNDYYDADSWKADFNKAVSGLHSMISAHIVKGIQDKIQAGEPLQDGTPWTDPQQEFNRRLSPDGETPRAISNLYFGYMLMLTAVSKARTRLLQDCDAQIIDPQAADALRPVLSHPLFDDLSITVASNNLLGHANMEQDSLWEARMRTRELMRIMNCVQCNKCRLHGKIAVLGLSTALQVLLGSGGEGGDELKMHRVELAALMTTLSKFSTAVSYCQKMTTN
uniref:Endoplasmic reticulum oxidoreductin 1 n=1 Tax=Ditylum brightwellii TaxID=49249 RepID=A0A7S4QTG6_9STRA|mmetsp:Transcript_8127/g.10927  ORF Transcript_8127/g.10927 Transcript_8127/m.10927 type:complete len:405 (-) Transcript_8127:105-1319(-)